LGYGEYPIASYFDNQRLFKFIFMKRSWAADKDHLTEALLQLAKEAQASDESAVSKSSTSETAGLLRDHKKKRSPLWLLIFPEGTINSDEERRKSAAYAKRESIVCPTIEKR
jgi:lysocardiolipin and lysophospholipid acyltransferase